MPIALIIELIPVSYPCRLRGCRRAPTRAPPTSLQAVETHWRRTSKGGRWRAAPTPPWRTF